MRFLLATLLLSCSTHAVRRSRTTSTIQIFDDEELEYMNRFLQGDSMPAKNEDGKKDDNKKDDNKKDDNKKDDNKKDDNKKDDNKKDDNKKDDNKKNDGGDMKKNEGGDMKKNDGGDMKKNDGGEAKKNDGGDMKKNDGGGEAKKNEGGDMKKNDGGEAKKNQGGDMKKNNGGEAKKNEGGDMKNNNGGEVKKNDGRVDSPTTPTQNKKSTDNDRPTTGDAKKAEGGGGAQKKGTAASTKSPTTTVFSESEISQPPAISPTSSLPPASSPTSLQPLASPPTTEPPVFVISPPSSSMIVPVAPPETFNEDETSPTISPTTVKILGSPSPTVTVPVSFTGDETEAPVGHSGIIFDQPSIVESAPTGPARTIRQQIIFNKCGVDDVDRSGLIFKMLQKVSNIVDLTSEDKAEYMARVWMDQEDPKVLCSIDPAFQQRYLAAMMFFAWNGPETWKPESAATWLSGAHECEWFGITCNEDQVVTELELKDHGLEGLLPTELFLLESLKKLSVDHNDLSGPIPSTIAQLQELEILELDDNRFGGRIPESMYTMESLKAIDLNDNFLSGAVMSEGSSWGNLMVLQIENNLLTSLPSADALSALPELILYSCYGNPVNSYQSLEDLCETVESRRDDSPTYLQFLVTDCLAPCSCCSGCV